MPEEPVLLKKTGVSLATATACQETVEGVGHKSSGFRFPAALGEVRQGPIHEAVLDALPAHVLPGSHRGVDAT